MKAASKNNEVTNWIRYFTDLVIKDHIESERQINFILQKTRFFDQFKDKLNERQLKVVKRMMQAGIDGFEGGMSARKYEVITGASKATATRVLQQLFSINVLKQLGSRCSVRYELNL